MAKAPDERFPTMKDFARALREIARALPAPQPRLELATPSPTSTGSFAGLPPTDESVPGGASLSADFDSMAATLRLAQLTEPSLDTTRITMIKPAPVATSETPSETAPVEPAPVVGKPGTGAQSPTPPPKAPEPKPIVAEAKAPVAPPPPPRTEPAPAAQATPAKPAPAPAPKPAAVPAEPPVAELPFPVVPAAVLGTLALLALALGVALAL
jgi:hypothetical protein